MVGYDIEAHRYPKRQVTLMSAEHTKSMHGKGSNGSSLMQGVAEAAYRRGTPVEGEWMEYPGELVIQDVLTLHGSQFKDAALIVASPPCQEYSYMAMPWSLAKEKARKYESGELDVADLTRLFDACFRIQREAEEAAGHHIPLIVENVRGAQKWVGRAKWNFGSYYLWGDVPALMPFTFHAPKRALDDVRAGKRRHCEDGQVALFGASHETRGVKVIGQLSIRHGHGHTRHLTNQSEHDGSKSNARKAASAMIAKIPLALSTHIARVFYPKVEVSL